MAQLEWNIFPGTQGGPLARPQAFGAFSGFGVTFAGVQVGTTPYPPLSAQAILTVALRALRGLITYPGGLDPQVIYTETVPFLGAGEEAQIVSEVNQEVSILESPVSSPEPVNPFVPHLPGQTPVGTNPNDTYLPGGNSDPAGPVAPYRSWASSQEIIDDIRRRVLVVVGNVVWSQIPEAYKKVGGYLIGTLIQLLESDIQRGRMDHARRKAQVARVLELQDFWARLLEFPGNLWTQEFLYQTLAREGVPITLPKEPEPTTVRCISCGGCGGDCTCRTDSK